MKTFTQFNESLCITADKNQGNSINLGVMNHYTPIENIVTNVKNFFASLLGCVVCVGEDGVSIKIHSTKFVNKDEINRLLTQPIFNTLCMRDYIMQQGLDLIKMINIGQYWVVYFCPRDIPQATTSVLANPECGDCAPCAACHEQIEDEAEMFNFVNEDADDEEEIEDITKQKMLELIKLKDKVKAAKQFELLVSKSMELPREYYFASVKDKDSGNESIALRWRYSVRRPNNKTAEKTVSVMNIFGVGDDAIWVQYFDKKSYFQIPKEVETLINNILELIGAEKTKDDCIYSIPEDGKKKPEDNQEKEETKSKESETEETPENNKENNKENSKKSDSDDKRGDDTDDLLS